MGENLLERAPVHPRFPKNLPFTDTLYQHSSTNLGPLFHIAVHPPVLSGLRSSHWKAKAVKRGKRLTVTGATLEYVLMRLWQMV